MRSKKPIWLIVLTILGEILLLPLQAKISRTMRPPSSAGNGNKFTTARLIEMTAMKARNEPIPSAAAIPPYFAIPIGPESSERTFLLPVKILETREPTPASIALNSWIDCVNPVLIESKNPNLHKQPAIDQRNILDQGLVA